MTIICVDDEQSFTDQMEAYCRTIPGAGTVHGFTDPGEVLSYFEDESVDVAFLDINMPEMDGLTLATKIKERAPSTQIVFVTESGEHAVEAFALRASGYLLKPVSPEKLYVEAEYAMSRKSEESSALRAHIEVKTFGNFDVYVDGALVSFKRSKAKETLAYLVDKNGSSVSRKELFLALWEEGDYDRSAQKLLDNIIRSMRTTLDAYGIGEICELKRGNLKVNTDRFSCDFYRFMEGDPYAINSFRGEYMSAYYWANMTESFLANK